jgi:hypothetical protein
VRYQELHISEHDRQQKPLITLPARSSASRADKGAQHRFLFLGSLKMHNYETEKDRFLLKVIQQVILAPQLTPVTPQPVSHCRFSCTWQGFRRPETVRCFRTGFCRWPACSKGQIFSHALLSLLLTGTALSNWSTV